MSTLPQRCIRLYRRASREKPGEEDVFEICCLRGLLPSIAKRSVRASPAVETKKKFGSKTQQSMLQQGSYFPNQKMAREQLQPNLGKNG